MEKAPNSLHENNSNLQSRITDEHKSVTVSKETFAYAKCLRHLNELWGLVYYALELSYGMETAEEIISNEYAIKSNAINEMILEYMCITICENAGGNKEFTKI